MSIEQRALWLSEFGTLPSRRPRPFIPVPHHEEIGADLVDNREQGVDRVARRRVRLGGRREPVGQLGEVLLGVGPDRAVDRGGVRVHRHDVERGAERGELVGLVSCVAGRVRPVDADDDGVEHARASLDCCRRTVPAGGAAGKGPPRHGGKRLGTRPVGGAGRPGPADLERSRRRGDAATRPSRRRPLRAAGARSGGPRRRRRASARGLTQVVPGALEGRAGRAVVPVGRGEGDHRVGDRPGLPRRGLDRGPHRGEELLGVAHVLAAGAASAMASSRRSAASPSRAAPTLAASPAIERCTVGTSRTSTR